MINIIILLFFKALHLALIMLASNDYFRFPVLLNDMKRRFMYIGAGAGLVLFAIFGLFPGSFFGGVMGLNISGLILGYPVTESIVSRIIVGLSMMLGVTVAGLIFVLGGTAAGWLIGSALSAVFGRSRANRTGSDENLDL